MRRAALCLSVLACALAAPSAAQADVPEGAVWTEQYFTTADGIRLHADVLRPEGMTNDDKTPVVLTVSPYTNHSGQQGVDFNPNASGPSPRFDDLLKGAELIKKGYTYVIVDLRGFGGSGGCNDWGGPGEQEDVRAAVRWAATQPWSTGKVGMYGKSYDGFTGIMGVAAQPRGLAAVVAMEPVYDGYRYRFSNGIRFGQSYSNPALFSVIDAQPGAVDDTPEYFYNSVPRPDCYAANIALQQQDEAGSIYWRQRELITRSEGSTVPTFLTQGFLETNTKSDGAFTFFNQLAGPKRAWFGQFDHDRGNDVQGERLVTGRPGWFDEVVRFYDEHLKGIKPEVADAEVIVQDNTGTYREEQAWPPADAAPITGDLVTGTFADDGTGTAQSTQGVWTLSTPLPHDARLAGPAFVTLDAAADVPRSNLVVDLYDVDPEGVATVVSRAGTLVRRDGRIAGLELYGQDWRFREGHRIAVRLTDANSEWYTHVPTRGEVTITDATIDLPFRRVDGGRTSAGEAGPRLDAWLEGRKVQLPEQLIADGERAGFPIPTKMRPVPAPVARKARAARGR